MADEDEVAIVIGLVVVFAGVIYAHRRLDQMAQKVNAMGKVVMGHDDYLQAHCQREIDKRFKNITENFDY